MFFLLDSACKCGISNRKICGEDEDVTRIVNGVEAGLHEYPWQAALVHAGGHTPFCGGSIISNKHILTAAHCTNIKLISNIEVLVGEHDLTTVNDDSQRMRILRIHEHPNFNLRNYVAFDYSIIVLADKLHFSK